MSTDRHWESWGARDPYFGVLTHPRFRSAVIDAQARDEFFHTGRVHAQHVVDTCRQRIAPDWSPARILDFGCGVGRVLIPFARLASEEAVGVDVSPSMLAEAQRNCAAEGVQNVHLVPSDDTLSQVQGEFDLVHSCIVLQHIEVTRGRDLFRALVQRIRLGGLGALHVTFGWDAHDAAFGQPPLPPPPPQGLRAWIAGLRAATAPAPSPSPDADPEMQMNFYNLSELQYVLQRAGVERLHTEFTDHGGAIGAFMFFRRG